MKPLFNRLNALIPITTLCVLIVCVILLVRQQQEISKLQSELAAVSSSIDDNDAKINDLDTKLDGIESALSDDIEDVRKTVITWSH